MASSLGSDQEPQLGKPVQELAAINGREPPPRYIIRDGDHNETIDGNPSLSSSIPTVDLQLLSSPSTPANEKEAEMEKLGSALRSWGFFQAIGHGIPSSLLDELRNVAKGFFDLPTEEKLKYTGIDGSIDSYGTDSVVSDDQVLNWSDRLYLLVRPENQRNFRYWPDNPVRFREILHEYSMKTSLVAQATIKAMARVLGLEENYFVNQLGDQYRIYARFNYYPPCSKPDLVYGIRPHTDGGLITIVLQDPEVEGLQVLKDGQWIKVPIVPYALLINVADQTEIMSNGIFKSSMHRVLTNPDRERISLAMFYLLEIVKEIEPADALIDEVRPRLFRKVKVKDYEKEFNRSYSQGKRAINWAKV
ncbi:protein SRG1-like isoform X2 [Telopea speciosissima]|uniref:protein SRG1-like isoform X2 n=1 Tax=Telopea speciosissima TaxID=54955 RepID=UPI001CC6064F|nr:protein SRG1-like isoform X2 [Telopea speciosissima]